MPYLVAVCYGRPTDPDAFDAHYRDVHIPLAREVPGLSDFTYGKCASTDATEPAFYAVANLVFPDAETMRAGMSSPQMRAAAKDVPNFATGTVTMYTQEVSSFL